MLLLESFDPDSLLFPNQILKESLKFGLHIYAYIAIFFDSKEKRKFKYCISSDLPPKRQITFKNYVLEEFT